MSCILAEGAIALSVTLSGGALFASWKLLQFPSSLIVKVILAIFMGASAQRAAFYPYLTSWQFALLLLRSASQSFASARNSRLLLKREWYALGVQFFHEHWFRAHTFSAFWLWSSVVSVLISVTTDMSPTGDLLVTSIFAGENVLLSLLRGF